MAPATTTRIPGPDQRCPEYPQERTGRAEINEMGEGKPAAHYLRAHP